MSLTLGFNVTRMVTSCPYCSNREASLAMQWHSYGPEVLALSIYKTTFQLDSFRYGRHELDILVSKSKQVYAVKLCRVLLSDTIEEINTREDLALQAQLAQIDARTDSCTANKALQCTSPLMWM